MSKVTIWLNILALVACHTRTVASTNGTTTEENADVNFDIDKGLPESDVWSSCSLRIPTQVALVVLGCVGIVVNTLSLVIVVLKKDVNRPFRVVLCSMTAANLGFAVTSVLTGSLAIAATLLRVQEGTNSSTREPLALSTICNVLIGLYHSLLGCGATTTLVLSLDRLVAVFAPIQYRVLGVSGTRMSAAIFPSWLLTFLCTLALVFTWHFQGDREQLQLSGMSCWPLVAVKVEFLVFQAILLLMSSIGVTVTHICTIHKLTKRAILVVPGFGPRTADSSVNERQQTRRSANHAAIQALCFFVLYLPYAVYLLWLATGTEDRRPEVCELRFLLLSLFPAFSNLINPLLTPWRLQDVALCCYCCCSVPKDQVVRSMASKSLQSQQEQSDLSKIRKVADASSPTRSPHGSVWNVLHRNQSTLEPKHSLDQSLPDGQKSGGHDKNKSCTSLDNDYHIHPWAGPSHETETTSHKSSQLGDAHSDWCGQKNNYNDDACKANPTILKSRKTEPDMTSELETHSKHDWMPRRDNYCNDTARADAGLLKRKSVKSVEEINHALERE